MLYETDCAPDFILPDKATGGQLALADYIGRCRVALSLVPSPRCAASTQQFLERAAQPAEAAGVSERHLCLIAVVGPDAGLMLPPGYPETLHLLTDASGETMKQYEVPTERCAFYLVGKDGTIKQALPEPPSLADLFAVVDAMPMRQREIAAGV